MIATQPKNLKIRNVVENIEHKIRSMEGAVEADAIPLKHTYGDGCYIREITMPRGMIIVSKIHKVTHPYFVLKGDVSVLTEEGIVRLKAPYSGITKAGTKRILYTHEETVWTTVHLNPTNTQDLAVIEKDIIAKDYKEVENKSLIQGFIEQLKGVA